MNSHNRVPLTDNWSAIRNLRQGISPDTGNNPNSFFWIIKNITRMLRIAIQFLTEHFYNEWKTRNFHIKLPSIHPFYSHNPHTANKHFRVDFDFRQIASAIADLKMVSTGVQKWRKTRILQYFNRCQLCISPPGLRSRKEIIALISEYCSRITNPYYLLYITFNSLSHYPIKSHVYASSETFSIFSLC